MSKTISWYADSMSLKDILTSDSNLNDVKVSLIYKGYTIVKYIFSSMRFLVYENMDVYGFWGPFDSINEASDWIDATIVLKKATIEHGIQIDI